MAYSALVGTLDRENGTNIVAAVQRSHATAQIDIYIDDEHAQLVIVDGELVASYYCGEADPTLIERLEEFEGAVYTLAREADEALPYAPPERWVLLMSDSARKPELEGWIHSKGYGLGLVTNAVDLPQIVDLLDPAAVLLDCPRVAGITCEQLRQELRTVDSEGNAREHLVITQSCSSHRFECGFLRKKVEASWTGEKLKSLSSVRLCQISPFSVDELSNVIEDNAR